MRNPWVHDDEEVDSSAGNIHQSNIRWLGILVWATLAVLVAVFLPLAGDQLTMPSVDQAATMLLTIFGAVLFVLFVVPVLLKLLAISRLLTAVVVIGSLGVGGQFLVTNEYLLSPEYQSLTEFAEHGFQDILELVEAFFVAFVL